MRTRRPVIAVVAALIVGARRDLEWRRRPRRRPTDRRRRRPRRSGPGRRSTGGCLGTNLPAWVGPERLADPAFVDRDRRLGRDGDPHARRELVGRLRLAGLREQRRPGASPTDAARPQDYVGFLDATGAAGMWTVNVNATAQAAAALVGLFNGAVDDERPIGVDRDGVDWQTVGTWAQPARRARAPRARRSGCGRSATRCGAPSRRRSAGAPRSAGRTPGPATARCTSTATTAHDGFLATRAAMRAVDPAIAVGAVGDHRPGSAGATGATR